MENSKTIIQYAQNISKALLDAISDEDHSNHFKLDDEELTEFFHALATVAPTEIYNYLTDDNKNHLEFNHLANQLCFQFMNKKD
ncbi:hypothetical protein [Formosa sp. A9]|uniref:hypothetical protein n=1 Tax=Formosa sp. A9 TaxID=3442641 RepID=UPI003EB6B741